MLRNLEGFMVSVAADMTNRYFLGNLFRVAIWKGEAPAGFAYDAGADNAQL
jgi:hypothetical protein